MMEILKNSYQFQYLVYPFAGLCVQIAHDRQEGCDGRESQAGRKKVLPVPGRMSLAAYRN